MGNMIKPKLSDFFKQHKNTDESDDHRQKSAALTGAKLCRSLLTDIPTTDTLFKINQVGIDSMANSRFEYVRGYERATETYLLPNTHLVIRVDGRGFHKFTDRHKFEKPNDLRALNLMNAAAISVMSELSEIVLAYGMSDEYSFMLRRNCNLFDRRASKLVSTIVSTFTAHYIFQWKTFFPETELIPPLPTFDGRVVVYPTIQVVKDYFAWRQVDCHINNIYNTAFWSLIQKGGMNSEQAEKVLQGTFASDKHEIMFSRYGLNYNNEYEIFRKGSIIFHEQLINTSKVGQDDGTGSKNRDQTRKRQQKGPLVVSHEDMLKEAFWDNRPWLLD